MPKNKQGLIIKKSQIKAQIKDQDLNDALLPQIQSFNDQFHYANHSFQRRIFFLHIIKSMIHIKKKIHSKEKGDINIDETDIPNIDSPQQSLQLSGQVLEALKNNQIRENNLFKLILKEFKTQIIFILFFFLIEVLCRLIFSFLIQLLFQIVTRYSEPQIIYQAYLLANLCGLVLMISHIYKQNGYYQVDILAGKIRSFLLALIYYKISSISSFTYRSHKLGKIINVLSNDFNEFQAKLSTIFAASFCPIIFVGASLILNCMLGLYGLLIPLVIILTLAIQYIIGKANGKIAQKAKSLNDHRVKSCVEIIEGIKHIKTHCLENLFKKKVQILRRLSAKQLFKLFIGKSIEFTMSVCLPNWGVFLCFLVIQFTRGVLTIPTILSTLGIIVILREFIFYTGVAIEFLFEAKVIFSRISDVI